MHYAEFAEDEVRPIMTHLHHMLFLTLPANQSVALREAIKEYEANKWKTIGQKVGKPAKVSFYFFFFFRFLVSHFLFLSFDVFLSDPAEPNPHMAGMRTICEGTFQECVICEGCADPGEVTTLFNDLLHLSSHPFTSTLPSTMSTAYVLEAPLPVLVSRRAPRTSHLKNSMGYIRWKVLEFGFGFSVSIFLLYTVPASLMSIFSPMQRRHILELHRYESRIWN